MAGPNRGSQAEELLQCYRKGKRARLETTANIEDTEVVDMPTSSNQAISPGYQRSAGSEQSDAAPHLVQSAKDVTTNVKLPTSVKPPGTSSLGGHKFYGRRSKSKQWNALLKHIATANKTFILAEEEARRQRAARSVIWQVFPTQDMAFTFADAHGSKDAEAARLAVLSVEDASTGRRRFLVTTFDVFWKRYQVMLPVNQHYYEIIREGCPCHLYLDLEYLKAPNPAADPEAMMAALLDLLQRALHDQLGLRLLRDALVELDSSTDDKFSRHLIVPLPGHAFKNNAHVGAFVKKFCSTLRATSDSDPLSALLFIWKAGEGPAEAGGRPSSLFIDEAVYTRNRAFRLPYSCKFGKTARLLPTSRYKCKNLAEREVFFSSLVCPSSGFRSMDLVSVFDEAEAQVGRPHIKGRIVKASRAQEASPYPHVDDFIQNIASVDEPPARLRNWSLFAERGVLVYNVDNNRYCERIGRQHKSNNVMYVVDFMLAGYYQKCHDPDCREFRFSVRPLPPRLLPEAFCRDPLAQSHPSVYAARQDAELEGRHCEARAGTGIGHHTLVQPQEPVLPESNHDEAPPEWWEKVGEIASIMQVETW